MSIINTFIGTPLGWLMRLCYELIGSYGLAIVLFTLLSKVVLLPVSILVQKNSIKMIRLQPEMNQISLRYAGDKDKIAEEQMALYAREHYHPFLSMVPLLIQIPLILGLINVIYNPMQHLLQIPTDVCSALVEAAGVTGSGAQLAVMEKIAAPGGLDWLCSLSVPGADLAAIGQQVLSFDTTFLGINLADVPPLVPVTVLSLVPVGSCLSTLVLCVCQNRANVLQREQGFWAQWGTTLFTVAFSTYFTFLVPAGVGMYWICSNLFACIQLYVLNWLYKPEKYIDYETLEQTKQLLAQQKQRDAELKKQTAPYRQKERADYRRFMKDDETKQLVFYSESSGFYKYFEGYIEEILANSDLTIHYVTGDPNDAIFQKENPRIQAYYIGEYRLIPFMMKMDADMVVMTMPDLETYHIKRSYVRKNIEYVYTDHGVSSDNLMLRTHALDHFDTLFCVGPHQVAEARAIEALYGLKPRTLVEVGYDLLDRMIADFGAMPLNTAPKKTILIGPSWQVDNILDSCLDPLLKSLLPLGHRIILRPHPQYVRLYPDRMHAIASRYASLVGEDFIIQTDFSSTDTVYSADLLITDWSNIGYEYALSTLKPVLYINTPMKVMNPEWEQIDVVPFDIRIRDQIGASLDPSELSKAGETAANLLARAGEFRDLIRQIRETEIFNLGSAAKVGADYIIRRCEELRLIREAEEEDDED